MKEKHFSAQTGFCSRDVRNEVRLWLLVWQPERDLWWGCARIARAAKGLVWRSFPSWFISSFLLYSEFLPWLCHTEEQHCGLANVSGESEE